MNTLTDIILFILLYFIPALIWLSALVWALWEPLSPKHLNTEKQPIVIPNVNS